MEAGSKLKENVSLAPLTTIRLGGKAKYFLSCEDPEELVSGIQFAEDQRIRWTVLGGGSNVIFPDETFDGLVIRIEIKGLRFDDQGSHVVMEAGAGESWDRLVSECVANNFAGIECLSGIPGLVGATPIQNVGAYGQEVSDTILSVKAIDLTSMEAVEIPNEECEFGYRMSRFKGKDRGRFVVTSVSFRLGKGGEPTLRYPELRDYLEHQEEITLAVVREAVLRLRRNKSMVIDARDPNSRSVGSFFMNPIITTDEFRSLEDLWKQSGGSDPVPSFPFGDDVKVPAAWLVEKSGFEKGFRKGGVGISAHHTLALVNHGGTTGELLELAHEIRQTVHEKFRISLVPEPTIIE